MIRTLIAAAALLTVASPTLAAPTQCRDAKGHFTKCPEAKAPPARCKDAKGKFAKCGTPGATPVASK